MTDPEQYLSFSNLENDRPVVAFCSLCGRRFEARPEVGKGIDELIISVRADYESHSCHSNQ